MFNRSPPLGPSGAFFLYRSIIPLKTAVAEGDTLTMFEATVCREFNPRPGQYSRMIVSSDQVTGKVFSSEHAFPSTF